jgi:hypothetical protein
MDIIEFICDSVQQVDSRQAGVPLPRHIDHLPSELCDRHDPDPCPLHHPSRWPQDGQDDRARLPPRYRPDWLLLQLELDLRKLDLSLPERCFHPDA